MANLIECPTCKQQVSENARVCPHCGEPIAKTVKRPRPVDNRKLAPVWVLPTSIATNDAEWLALAFSFAPVSNSKLIYLIIMGILTTIAVATLFISGYTSNNEYRARGVSIAALFVSMINILLGLVFILLTVINGVVSV